MANNYQENVLLTNLLLLHILVLSGVGTVSEIVTVMVGLTIIQFSFTVTCHVIFYAVCINVKQKILFRIKPVLNIMLHAER